MDIVAILEKDHDGERVGGHIIVPSETAPGGKEYAAERRGGQWELTEAWEIKLGLRQPAKIPHVPKVKTEADEVAEAEAKTPAKPKAKPKAKKTKAKPAATDSLGLGDIGDL